MTSLFRSSPYRRRRDGDGDGDDPFDLVSTKNAPTDRLRRWRQAALVLNSSRRYRYTLDLKKEEEKRIILRKIEAHAKVIRAAYLFKEASASAQGTTVSYPPPIGDFGISQEQLSEITRDHNHNALVEIGGVKGVADALKTNLEKGIHGDHADLLKRKSAFGSNTYPQKKGKSLWIFLGEACQDLTLIMLMIAAVVSIGLGMKTDGIKKGWYDGASIAFAVIVGVVVTAINDYRQDLQFNFLIEKKRNIHLEVIRDGRRPKVSIFDVVVGDVVPLKIGDQIPADGILIPGCSLDIDESSMTGESKIVHKNSREPFLMSGCKVVDGSGTMLVSSVGVNTKWGLLMASTSEDTGEETPLQVYLNGVATFIGSVGLALAAAVLVVLSVRFFTGHTKNLDGRVQFREGNTSAADAINGATKILAVSVATAVVAVPEGLPLAVTLILSFLVKKLLAENALVRRLSACETMGSMTTICTDKTGTLTSNSMTVMEVYVAGQKIDPPDSKSLLSPMLSSLVIEGIARNTTASVFIPEGEGDPVISGSPTEKAIVEWGFKLGMDFDAVRSESSVISVFLFNSEKKKGGVALQLPDSQVHIHWKGAAEIILASCVGYCDANGNLVQMDKDKELLFKNVIEDMAANSLRCIALAYKTYDMDKLPVDEQELAQWPLPEDDLVLLALIGLKNPCHPGVGDAVRTCQNAGIKVRMVTGDNPQTAKAIALECGILSSEEDAVEPNVIEGRVFREYSDSEREDIAEKISVMGRSSPNDKLLLVQALIRRGHVVAVTGDGTNDAPALHEADIGLSMGSQGTQVTKEASDIVLLDDNFSSIPKVVLWGRSIYVNIQKFKQFQLTIIVASVIINAVGAASGGVQLNTVQLLWVNLVMDTLGAWALVTEPPTDNLMRMPPVGRREPLITNILWRNLLFQSLLGLEHEIPQHANKVKNTLIFNAFVLCQIFNEVNSRKPDELNIFKGILKSHLFIGINAVTLLLQVIIIEFGGKFTSTVRLNWKMWLISVAIAFMSWPLAFIGKFIPVPKSPLHKFFTRRFHRGRRAHG
eukprot:XP_024446555.1 calcium-transporting ATPase 10, plasma membrane-type isoform X2 [Populus trichocarpa]